MKVYNKLVKDAEAIATTNTSDALELESIYGYSMHVVVNSVTVPSNAVCASATDVDNATETFTKVAHGFATGLKVALTTSDTLPTGLSATDYYVIKVDADSFKIATSAALALAGTAQAFTTDGVGDQTFTPAALAACTVKLQATNDDAQDANVTPTWTDLSNTQAITTATTYLWNVADCFYRNVRVHTTMTAGQITLSVRMNAKGV